MFSISIIGDRTKITATSTGQEICLKGTDILELQKEINLVFPFGESPVRQVVQAELLDVARNSTDSQARIDACQMLLDYFAAEQPSNLFAREDSIQEMPQNFAELQKVCAPVLEYLKRFHPHTTVLITNSEIKLEET
jgi:hypothetical protein